MDKLSALMDGELAREEAAKLVADIKAHDALREAWSTYHVISEALRGEPCAECGVMPSVCKRLAQEPTILAPRRISGEIGKHWALPSMAAAAAVAMVSWMAVQTQQTGVEQPIAVPAAHMVIPVPVVAVQTSFPLPGGFSQSIHLPAQILSSTPIQLHAREFDAYLMAHQEFSPSTTLQGLAPYVRTVASGAVETGR